MVPVRLEAPVSRKTHALGGSFDRDFYGAIGRLLEARALEPSPDNFAFCYHLLAGEAQPSATGGRHRPELVAADDLPSALSAEMLEEIAGRAALSMEQLSSLLDRSGEDARAYGVELERGLKDLDVDPATLATTALISATRSMRDRIHTLERDLERSRGELTTLRGSLEQARRSAATDPLTGLPNRRALDAKLKDAIADARDGKGPLTIAICDIDYFKRFNDSYGHQVGDLVLQAVAETLADERPGKTFVARFGGEEFVMLFEGVSPEHAAADIEQVRDYFERRSWSVAATGQKLGRLTISIGVAAYRGRGGPAALLQRADKALYEAKRNGRNQVRVDG